MIKKVTEEIILASKSPRRKQLLKQIDFDFKVVPSQIDEDIGLDLKPFLFVQTLQKKLQQPVLLHIEELTQKLMYTTQDQTLK